MRVIFSICDFFSMNLQKYNQANALFPEMQMTRKIFPRAAANLFFLVDFPEIFPFLL